MSEAAMLISHRHNPPVHFQPGIRVLYANHNQACIRWHGGEFITGPNGRYTGFDIDTDEPFDIDLHAAMLAAARAQRIAVRLYRPKAKQRGRWKRLRRWWAYNARLKETTHA